MLRSLGPQAEQTDPLLQAQAFIQRFKAAYGDRHPRFVEQSLVAATAQANTEFKFLFVYLHSQEHQVRPCAVTAWPMRSWLRLVLLCICTPCCPHRLRLCGAGSCGPQAAGHDGLGGGPGLLVQCTHTRAVHLAAAYCPYHLATYSMQACSPRHAHRYRHT
jgi:hypothetical protein